MIEAPTRTGPLDPAAAMYGHSRTRTTSSNVFPSQHPSQHQYQQQQHYAQAQQQQHPSQQQQYLQHQYQQQQQHQHQQHQQHHQHHQHHQQLHPQHHQQPHHQMHSAQYHPQQPPAQSASNPQLWRRSPSIGTFSTASSFQQPPPAAYRTSTSDLRRSTSSRSIGTMSHPGGGSSYVALLRKQKATVWCERAQYEDPRVVAQQRAAKMRANLEVVSSNSGRTQTGLASAKVAGKIRHGKAPVVGYAPGETHVGVGGVPLRLSAREIDGDGSDDDDNNSPMMAARKEQHRRAGSSGRSSTGSGRQGQYRTSGSGTPARKQSLVGTPERTASLANNPQHQQQQANTQQPIDESAGPIDDAASGRAQSSRSGNSATASERRDDVLELGQGPRLAHNSKLNAALTREKSVKSPEELKRRGSVDERTATLTSGRLFIANPD